MGLRIWQSTAKMDEFAALPRIGNAAISARYLSAHALGIGRRLRLAAVECRFGRGCRLIAMAGPTALVPHRKHVANADSSSGSWLAPNPGFGGDK